MSTSWLAFTPRDTMFIRDGRSFDAQADAFGQTVRPGPATVAGAAGAAFGARPGEIVPGEMRGPVLARRVADAWEPYFPVPADLVVTADESAPAVFRLAREGLSGQTDLGQVGSDAGGAVASWLVPADHAEPVKPLEGWLPGHALARYLAGELPAAGGTPVEELEVADPLVPERRVGLARDEHRRTRTGFLYQAAHLRPEEGWGFLAEWEFPPGKARQPDGPVPFGGRGRLADVSPADVQWPAAPAGAIGQRVAVYLATPAVWPAGWRFPVPAGARLEAAVTGEPEPAATLTPGAGWRGTRMLRWAVPAGSVYLLEFEDAAEGSRWARAAHGAAYAGTQQLRTAERLRTAGFGVVLTGVWT